MVLYGVHSELEFNTFVLRYRSSLSVRLICITDKKASMSLSIGFALAWENASVEALLEKSDRNMYQVKNQRTKTIS